MKSKITLLSFYALLLFSFCKTQAQVPNLYFTPFITSGLNNPVYITHCNDDRVFIVEQDGRIRIKHPGVTALDTFIDINSRVLSGGEQGLLSMAFHPDYANNGYFFVNYTNNQGDTRISRFNRNALDSNKAVSSSEVIFMTVIQPYSNHQGGQLQFGPDDGYLYIGMGDGGSGNDPGNRAQNKDSLLGKMLRIDINNGTTYANPLDNPYINIPNARDEIWAIGVRNPWRFSFDRLTADLWIADVGQGAWEEVDYQPAGTGAGDNYGWRCWEGNHATGLSSCSGVVNQHPPVYEYNHTIGYSITGGYVYRGARYKNMYGHYLFVDYGNSQLQSLIPNGVGGFTHYDLATLNNGNASISSFGEDAYGELYMASLANNYIYLIRDSADIPVASIAATDTLNVCDSITTISTPFTPDFLYQWTFNSTAAGNSNSITVNQNGWYYVSVVNAAFVTNTDSVYVNLLGLPPTASFAGLDSIYCIYNPAVNLMGTPLGGLFTGSGISTSTFDPALAGLGTHLINYNYTDANGCLSKSTEIVRVDACVGLIALNGITTVELYPNPVSDFLQLTIEAAQREKVLYNITDVQGRIQKQITGSLNKGKNSLSFELDELESGIYFLNINCNGVGLSRKFVVVK